MSKEKRCVKECFNILNDFTAKTHPELDISALCDELNPHAKPKQEPKPKQEEETKEHDVLKGLQDEIDAVKQGGSKIYFVFDMGIPGVVFIKLVDWMRPYINVKKVGLAIVNHVAETKDPMSRFACRFIPVDFLCKANTQDFQKFVGPILA